MNLLWRTAIFLEPKKTFTNHSQADYRQTCWVKTLILWNLSDKMKEAKRFQKASHHVVYQNYNPTAHWQLIREVTGRLKTTCKELQASLASVKICVQQSTIRKRLGNKNTTGRLGKPTAVQEHRGLPKNILMRRVGKYCLDRWDEKWTFISGV